MTLLQELVAEIALRTAWSVDQAKRAVRVALVDPSSAERMVPLLMAAQMVGADTAAVTAAVREESERMCLLLG